MPRFTLFPGILFLGCLSPLWSAPQQPTLSPLLRVVDLNVGETSEVALCDGTRVQVKLLDRQETRDSIRNAVRIARVQVEIDGQTVWLTSGNYNLPVTAGKAQIDCPITKGPTTNSNGDHWGLEKDARLRLWPAGSPLFLPGRFVYPVEQRWFVSATQMANEPVFNNAEESPKVRSIYYHYGLDFGGAEILTKVVAATDGLVVSAGTAVLPGYADTPVATRYDVIYLLDAQGWYYRYSHLHSFAAGVQAGARVKAGQQLGLLGKEGASGGWSHLHLDIFCRQPSGKWGCQDAYAFAWEAYRKQYDPKLIAVARPHHFLAAGETALLDGGKSWSAEGKIVRYQWTFTDGTTAEGPRVERKYARPGYYSEILKVTDSAGRSDYDFAVVVVAQRDRPAQVAPALHVAYWPSLGVRAGDSVTFKARMFGATQGAETWDFGDGTPPAVTRSSRSAEPHAKDGYAVVAHRYERPGDYLVRVERKNDLGWPAIGRVHVPVGAGSKAEVRDLRCECQTNPASSQNHCMLGHAEEWFYIGLGGIRPAAPGFKRIEIGPQVVGDLDWIKAEYRSPYGLIATAWNREGQRLTLHVGIPANTTATVRVPAKDAASVTECGKPAAEAEGVKFLRMEDGAAVYAVVSGAYQFEAVLKSAK